MRALRDDNDFRSARQSRNSINDAYLVRSIEDLEEGLNNGSIYRIDDFLIIPRRRYPRWFIHHKEDLKKIPLSRVTTFGKRAPQPSKTMEFNIITASNSWVGFADTTTLVDWLTGALDKETMLLNTSGLKRNRSFKMYKHYKFRPYMATYIRPIELESDTYVFNDIED